MPDVARDGNVAAAGADGADLEDREETAILNAVSTMAR
jgi:hypothetical protein